MKKSIRLVLWSLLILLTAAAGIFAASWFASRRLPAQPELLKCRITPAHAELGEDVLVHCSFTLPLCRGVRELNVAPAPGTVLSGTAKIRWSMAGFTTRKWQITIPLRAYRPGEIPPGKLRFIITPHRQDVPEFTAELPGFTAKESTVSAALELAPESSSGSRFNAYQLFWLLLLLIPAGIWLAYHLRKQEKRRDMTEWEKAVRDLTEIKEKFHTGSIAPEQAFVGLVELMRRYLEKRFSIPVTRRTAQEFLLILDRHQDKLPPDSRPFLRSFIQEADMVKFARAVPEHASVSRSAESAGNFIQSTRPESEVKNV